MLKIFFRSSVLGALLGGISALRATLRGPRDWRVILLWIGWAITVAIAVGNVIEESREADKNSVER